MGGHESGGGGARLYRGRLQKWKFSLQIIVSSHGSLVQCAAFDYVKDVISNIIKN